MKQKYLLLTIILFVFLFLSSAPSLALIPGDFGSTDNGPPDGVVDFEDLMIFAMAYGSTFADAKWNEVCDIASQGGVLQPDGVIDFEDLMIFALHYGQFLVHNLTKDIYYDTIQVALDDADTENFIEVNNGTYNESITFPTDKVIILQSVNGSSSTIIRGNDGLNTVTFDGSLTGTILEGFTITHANGLIGRGVYIIDGNLSIENCNITTNHANVDDYTSGGGIYNRDTLTITESTISDNYADYGGGIRNDGDLTITVSTICNNFAADHCGGGIENCGSLTITESTVSNNTANSQGGGIYNDYDGSLTITGSTISINSAGFPCSAGIHLSYGGTITIGGSEEADKNTICSNYLDENGPSVGPPASTPTLDDQIGDGSVSLYDLYSSTNCISVECTIE